MAYSCTSVTRLRSVCRHCNYYQWDNPWVVSHKPLTQQLWHLYTCLTLHCYDAHVVFNSAHLQPLQAHLIAHHTMQATHDVDMQLGSEHRVWGYRILVGLLMLFTVMLYAGIWAYMQYYT